MIDAKRKWPPIPGDFHVKDSEGSIAVCTLGKKIEIDAEYGIIGTCKTENIGIERVIINVISNPSIRYLILAGPEVPGHLTGKSMRSLYNSGVDPNTRKIIDAPGAIPYIENIPLEAIERFRQQVEFVDMLNQVDPEKISQKVSELLSKKSEPFPEDGMWIDFKVESGAASIITVSGAIAVLPEYGVFFDYQTSLLSVEESHAVLTSHPSTIAIEVRVVESGTILVVKEL